MMKFLALTIVAALATPAFSQVIDRASGVNNNPVALQVVAVDGETKSAYTYEKIKNEDDPKNPTFNVKYLVLELSTKDVGNGSTFHYTVYSKTGQSLATHEIKENIYLRLAAVLSVATQKRAYGGEIEKINCPVMIQIDRGDYSLIKVTPTCDEFQ